MEFIGASFSRFMEWAFDDKSEAKPKNKITKDYCEYCEKSCHKRCDCRCHVASCKRCDYKECDYKKCDCDCHKNILPKLNSVEVKKNILVGHSASQSNMETAQEVKSSSGFGNLISTDSTDKPRKNIFKAYLDKRRKKTNIKEDEPFEEKKRLRIGSLIISKPRESEREYSPMIKFKPAKKSLAAETSLNISKDNHLNVNSVNVSKSENLSVTGSKLSSSFKVNKNPFIVSSIKKRIQSMKFKDLAMQPDQTILDNSNFGPSVNSFSPNIKQLDGVNSNNQNKLNKSYQGILNNLNNGQTENYSLSPLNNSVNMSVNIDNPALSPIPPGKKSISSIAKPHLNYSFDLNNSKLYQSKSSVVRKMEEMTRELDVKKQKDKDNQVKNVMKGFETQDAWQMYNSLIFSNPMDLPDAKDIKKTQEKPFIGDRSKLGKSGALTSQSKRK